MSAAIEKYKDKLERARQAASRARERAQHASAEVMDSGVVALTGYAWGAWEKRQRASNQTTQIAGIDGDIVVAVVGLIGGEILDDDAARVLRNVGRGAAAIAGYKRGLA